MVDLSPLTALCSICHHATPKYRCPRCSARTCSLVCNKRHKQWAQCSGLRNPAAYLKRDELVTPEGFDLDFNFITGIERKLDNAERDVISRGVKLHSTEPAPKRDGPRKGEINLQEALQKTRVIIDKAPPGMSRSLQNKTHWNKNHRCISWTVEWILEGGHAELGACLDIWPVSKGFAAHNQLRLPLVEKSNHAKRKRSSKRAVASSSEARPASPHNAALTVSKCEVLIQNISPNTPPSSLSIETQIVTQPPSQDQQPPNQSKRHRDAISNDDTISASTSTPSFNYFYLHVPSPQKPSSKPTLVPLSQSTPLAKILQNRVVREFPSIYALSYSPNSLPTQKYTLERDHAAEAELARAKLLDMAGPSRSRAGSEQIEMSTPGISRKSTDKKPGSECESGPPASAKVAEGVISIKEEPGQTSSQPVESVSVDS